MTARALTEVSAGSYVDGALTVAALCPFSVRAGHCVAALKAQNMSLSSVATPARFETGAAEPPQPQTVGFPSSIPMNPILDQLANTFACAIDLNSVMGLLDLSAHAA